MAHNDVERSCSIFVINLDRRTDRLKKMEARLDGVDFTRISAIDVCSLHESVKVIDGPLSSTEKACISSHIKALKAFLRTPYETCVILEDDVIFGNDFLKFINGNIKFPKHAYVLKLDTFFQKVWLSRFFLKSQKFRLHRLHSLHYSAAAYCTSRKGAQLIIDNLLRYQNTTDDIIFGDMLNLGKAYQLNPACCVQEFYDEQHLDSDIYNERVIRLKKHELKYYKTKNKDNITKFIREISRVLDQLKSILIKAIYILVRNTVIIDYKNKF